MQRTSGVISSSLQLPAFDPVAPASYPMSHLLCPHWPVQLPYSVAAWSCAATTPMPRRACRKIACGSFNPLDSFRLACLVCCGRLPCLAFGSTLVPRLLRGPMPIWPPTWPRSAGLFDQARLAALPEALTDYQKLGGPTVVARTLLAQINYTADVAANMPPHTYTTAVASSDLPGERDRTP